MSLIEGYRKNVWTITVTDQTFFGVLARCLAPNPKKSAILGQICSKRVPGGTIRGEIGRN